MRSNVFVKQKARLTYKDGFHFRLNPDEHKQEEVISAASINTPLIDRFNYRTHSNKAAETFYKMGEGLLAPGKWALKCLAVLIEPDAGESKGRWFRNTLARIGGAIGFTLLTPIAIPAGIFGFLLRAATHRFRPVCSIVVNENIKALETPSMNDKEGLDNITIENAGLVPYFMSPPGSLPDAVDRAHQRVKWADAEAKKNQLPPLQVLLETFSRDANEVLVAGLSKHYRYVYYNIAPHVSGLNSGAMILSQYPIKQFDFYKFADMIGPERLAPRGAAVIRIETTTGDFELTTVHTQSLPGKTRALARREQLQFVNALQAASDATYKCLAGDTNTSYVTAWNEHNMPQDPSVPAEGYPEKPVLQFLEKHYEDPYLNDHDKLGNRIPGSKPQYLEQDKALMKELGLDVADVGEPQGSWRKGPFNKRPLFMRIENWFNKIFRNIQELLLIDEIQLNDKHARENAETHWGTENWQRFQTSKPTRFDQFQLPTQTPDEKPFLQNLTATVEIRHRGCSNSRSAISDHNAISACFRAAQPKQVEQKAQDKQQGLPVNAGVILHKLNNYIQRCDTESTSDFRFFKTRQKQRREVNVAWAKTLHAKVKANPQDLMGIFNTRALEAARKEACGGTELHSCRSNELNNVIALGKNLVG